MDRVQSSRAPITAGARFLMVFFVGLVATVVVLVGVGATVPEGAAVGVVVGLLLAAASAVARRR